MLFGVGSYFQDSIVEFLSNQGLFVLSPVYLVLLYVVFEQDVNRQVAPLDCDVVRRLSYYIADAECTTKMAAHEIRSLIIYV